MTWKIIIEFSDGSDFVSFLIVNNIVEVAQIEIWYTDLSKQYLGQVWFWLQIFKEIAIIYLR